MDEYKNLANGIIEQACKDYMWSIRYIKKHDHPELMLTNAVGTNIAKAKVLKRDCEDFLEAGTLRYCLTLTVKKLLNT